MDENQNGPHGIKDVLYSLNYIYYGLYFLFFAGLQVYHVFLVSPLDNSLRLIYAVNALFASFIEVSFMALVSAIFLRYKKVGWNRVFLLLTGLLLLLRVIDFLLVRLMDISIWHGLEFIMQETFSNFIEMLYATSVPLSVWFIGFLLAVGSLVFGWGFFYVTEKICQKKPLLCSAKSTFGVIALSFSCLALTSISLNFLQTPIDLQREYVKAIPWKTTLLFPEEETLTVGRHLKTIAKERSFLQEADSSVFSLERKPDLFLFVVESLRQDFLTNEVTPALAQFREENANFSKALSVSNATQTSWFSIFYSLYPFYWTQYQDKECKQGSPALALLKKMGYQIHTYSASRLSFYSMRRILFGGEGVVDSLKEFQNETPIPPYQADAALIQQLCQDVQSSEKKGGRVFIIFLDSTHFDYSWPQDQEPLFFPIEEKFNYIKMSCIRDNIDEIKNRYRNSLNYVDGLFKTFQTTLEKKGIWDDSVVVFTADHGEEFNEYGHMFHASTLTSPQLEIPLYIKLGKDAAGPMLNTSKRASQMDVFPTFFHYIIGENIAAPFFQGESLLTTSAKNYVVGARYNASRTPYQFYIQSGSYRMILEFVNRHDVLHCNCLKIHSIEDENGEKVPFTSSLVTTHFQEAFDALFGPTSL